MEFFIFGSLWFWIGFLVAGGLIAYFLEKALEKENSESGGLWATIVVAGFVATYFFFGSKEHIYNIFEFITSNIGKTVLIFGGYLALGVVWAFVKWYFYLLNKRDQLDKEIDTMYIHTTESADKYIPSASKNKARIISWMTYWPFSGVWTLINDPVRRAFQFVFRNVESYFQTISNKIFAGQHAAITARIEKRKADELQRNSASRK